MTGTKKALKICSKGHRFYKSSDCPVCTICEKERKPVSDFLVLLAAPARRAFENEGIITLKKLSQYAEAELLKLHGMGKTSLPKLKAALAEKGLSFKK